MFRFTIRELVLLTLVVAMGYGDSSPAIVPACAGQPQDPRRIQLDGSMWQVDEAYAIGKRIKSTEGSTVAFGSNTIQFIDKGSVVSYGLEPVAGDKDTRFLMWHHGKVVGKVLVVVNGDVLSLYLNLDLRTARPVADPEPDRLKCLEMLVCLRVDEAGDEALPK